MTEAEINEARGRVLLLLFFPVSVSVSIIFVVVFFLFDVFIISTIITITYHNNGKKQ